MGLGRVFIPRLKPGDNFVAFLRHAATFRRRATSTPGASREGAASAVVQRDHQAGRLI